MSPLHLRDLDVCALQQERSERDSPTVTQLNTKPVHVCRAEKAARNTCNGQKATRKALFHLIPSTIPHLHGLTFINGLMNYLHHRGYVFVGFTVALWVKITKLYCPANLTISSLVAKIMKVVSSLTPGGFNFLVCPTATRTYLLLIK